MLVYLQPFFTKDFIDATCAHRDSLEGDIPFAQEVYLRGRFCVAVVSGAAQSVYYLCLWVFSSVGSFASLGLNKPMERFSDHVGALAAASLTSIGIAGAGIFHLSAPDILTAKISERADWHFECMLQQHEENLAEESQAIRHRARTRAAGRGEPAFPERYFDPAVTKMTNARKKTIARCREAFPEDPNTKYIAYSESYNKLRNQRARHSQRLKELPILRREIDKYLVHQVSLTAENGIADLYKHCTDVWAGRIRSWGHKFDREAYSRHCLKLFQKKKVTKHVERYVRDVREAENKDKAYNETYSELTAFFSEMKGHVSALDRPWLWVRAWRAVYPLVSSWKVLQAVDAYFDPGIHGSLGEEY